MSIAPVKCSVYVKGTAARAFEIFTKSGGAWWPRGKTPARNPHVDLVIEPKKGGRWFERDEEGMETQWGKVLDWDPPRRLVLGWQLNHQFRFDPSVLTRVEILFEELPGGVTRVSLEHRNLERLGAEAEALAGKIRAGWPERMGNFAQYVASHS
jgi:uncharacterized protein YndB with AHSA1/START domain